MTSEVCVMNRHAAVLAADSASTVTRWDGEKVETRYFKGANKIFQLSHHQPIGLMIFNSADLLRVPWEIIIKTFRDHLGQRSFNDLEGYAKEFSAFMQGNQQLFPDAVQREELIQAAVRSVFGLMAHLNIQLSALAAPETRASFMAGAANLRVQIEALPAPEGLDADKIAATIAAHQTAVAETLDFLGVSTEERNSIAEIALLDVHKRPASWLGTAGLVFAGFGDHDIFPKMVEYQSSGILGGTPVLAVSTRANIDHETPAALNAFAQTSMSDTFSMGFSRDVYELLMESLVPKLDDFAIAICAKLGVERSAVEGLNEMIGAASNGISDGWFERARKEHAYPLRGVLGNLPVDEMAELAETLVNLQSLKEKVTKPSATVGGPVDVAIITKHEGLVWKKRKRYFDTELNPRYLLRQQSLHR